MRKKAKKFFATMLASSMVINSLSFNTLAVENSSANQIVKEGGTEYYLADPTSGLAGEDNFDVWTRKIVSGTENEDEFEITLQVGSTIKAIPNDAAVVLVVDTSGSMMTDKYGNKWGWAGELPSDNRKLRIDYARESALEFAEEFVSNSGNAKRMLSVVEFGDNAFTCLPWINANNHGVLDERARKAIEAIDVNFIYDVRPFWDENVIEDFTLTSIITGLSEKLKAYNWSSEEYVHETKSFEKSYIVLDTQIGYKADYEEASPTNASPANASVASPSSASGVWHCTYEGCMSDNAEHIHCSYDDCDEIVSHTHCMYEICSNPTGHVHCTRMCWCDENHEEKEHCKALMKQCGLTYAHTHIRGCTIDGCQDTTPDHEHACFYGNMGKYPFYDLSRGLSYVTSARCLNSEPYHKHSVYDGDSHHILDDRIWQKNYSIGTNLEGGLTLARNLVKLGLQPDGKINGIDEVYVILLSDGRPTWNVNQDNVDNITTEMNFLPGRKGGGSNSSWEDIKDIVVDTDGKNSGSDISIAKDIKEVANFYAIMYGSEMNWALAGNHSLSSVTCANWFKGTDPGYVGADLVLESAKADELDTVFANIQERIDLLAKAWVVSDELGDGVSFDSFTLNGEYAAFDSKETTISWNLGHMEPEGGSGKIDDPFIYTLKYKVTLNSDKQDVKEISKAYEANNTLSAVWTNKDANLQYFMVEKDELEDMSAEEIKAIIQVAEFQKPSVKAFYGDYAFVKKNSKTETVVENAGFTLYKDGKAVTREILSDHEGNVEFNDISSGTYILKETKVPNGMLKMPDQNIKVSYGNVTTLDGGEPATVIYNDPIGTKYNIIINYWDKENNSLLDSYVSDMMESGSTYDVSNRDDEIVFDGYTYDSQNGDSVTGTLDANKIINVYYVKKVDPTESESNESETSKPENSESESSEPESSEPETSPSNEDYVNEEPESVERPTQRTEPTSPAAPTEPTFPTEVVTDPAPETESLPYVAPDARPEDIPDDVVQAYYDSYINGDIDWDDIPVGVLGAFYEKDFPMMAVLPATGERSIFWTWMMLISLIGLAVTTVIDRKRTR